MKKVQIEKPIVRKPWHREPVQTEIVGESMTHQSHAASVDINNIVKQFHRTGSLPPARMQGQYLDVTGLQTDLTEAYNNSLDTINTFDEYRATKKRQAKEQESTTPPSPAPSPTPGPDSPEPPAE